MTGRRIKIISLAILVCVLSTVFVGCSKIKTGTAEKTKKLTDFQLGYSPTTAHLLGFVAAEEGFFQEEGINITLARFGNNQESVAALDAGKVDAFFLGSVPTISFQAAGHDITIFGGAMTGGHGYVLKSKYIPADYKEGDVTVLKGRNIATQKNSIMDYELQFLLKENGVEIGEGPDKVNIIRFESSAAAYAALLSNEIDGSSVIPPFISMAKDDGHTVVFYCKNIKAFESQPCCRQVAPTKALAARPELYIAVERAIIKAYKFTQENHEKTVDDVSKYLPIDKKVIEYEVYSGHALSHPDPDKKATSKLKKDVVEIGFTDGVDYDLEKLYNLDIYKKALAQLLAENPNDSIYKSLQERFSSAN
jgi:NitT/TauT family transport system substrate-binding protein